jgi:hypothetical protein
LIYPLSNVRAWRQSGAAAASPETVTGRDGKECSGDLQRDALMHWRRFCACLEALPAD